MWQLPHAVRCAGLLSPVHMHWGQAGAAELVHMCMMHAWLPVVCLPSPT